MLPFLAACAVLGLFGLLLMKLFDRAQIIKAEETNKVKKVTEEDWKNVLEYAYLEDCWIRIVLNKGLFSHRNQMYYGCEFLGRRYERVEEATAKKILEWLVADLKIPDILLNMPYSDFELIRSGAYSVHSLANWKKKETSVVLLHCQADKINKDFGSAIQNIRTTMWCDLDSFYDLYRTNFEPEYEKKIEEVNKEIAEENEEARKERDRKEALKKKHDAMCKKVSGPIAKFFTAIFSVIELFFIAMFNGMVFTCELIFIRLIWQIILVKFLWQIVILKGIWFLLRQIGIFIVYIWVVGKNLKHGACPYIQFIDPPKVVSVTSTSQPSKKEEVK
jgi:hypothetical protein